MNVDYVSAARGVDLVATAVAVRARPQPLSARSRSPTRTAP